MPSGGLRDCDTDAGQADRSATQDETEFSTIQRNRKRSGASGWCALGLSVGFLIVRRPFIRADGLEGERSQWSGRDLATKLGTSQSTGGSPHAWRARWHLSAPHGRIDVEVQYLPRSPSRIPSACMRFLVFRDCCKLPLTVLSAIARASV